MDTRTRGIIATVAAVILCGCPGLFLCIFGAATATGSMPYTTELNGISGSGTLPATSGYVMLCLSLILIIIPIAVGFFALRNRSSAPTSNEPMPPAS